MPLKAALPINPATDVICQYSFNWRKRIARPGRLDRGADRPFRGCTPHWGMDAKPVLSTCAGLSRPSHIDWQRWVGRDLKVRAVVIAVISVPIESVFAHPKDDLQRAFLAVDVGEANVGLME